jgi:chromatin segregation and condensation protein Rec8/ScpA/Scc1 (kleisin family)
VREHMSIVLRRLQGLKFVEFGQFFDVTQGVPVVVVHFLALLELAREGLVDITQADAYAPIYVRLSYAPAAPKPVVDEPVYEVDTEPSTEPDTEPGTEPAANDA